MKASTIIPKNFLPIPSKQEGSDPRRVTLLHKKDDALVCLISRSLDEISFGEPVQDAFILKMFGKEKVTIGYESEITFLGRKVEGEHYMVVDCTNGLTDSKQRKKIPFQRREPLVSNIATDGNSLDTKIDDLISIANGLILATCEAIADYGILRTSRSKELKDAKEYYKEAAASIHQTVSGLFHKEPDGKPVRKFDFRVMDRSLSNYFDDPRTISYKVKAFSLLAACVPIISLFPANLTDAMESEMRERYVKRFKTIEDEQEKAAIALSEFAVCNPKLLSGIRRSYAEAKAFCNLSTYAAQVGLTAYAYNVCSPWVSIPLIAGSALTGLTMLGNAIRSGGIDYSGVIATIIGRKLRGIIKD